MKSKVEPLGGKGRAPHRRQLSYAISRSARFGFGRTHYYQAWEGNTWAVLPSLPSFQGVLSARVGPWCVFGRWFLFCFFFHESKKKRKLGPAGCAGRPALFWDTVFAYRARVCDFRACCMRVCVRVAPFCSNSLTPPPSPPLRVSRSAAIAVRPGTEVGEGRGREEPWRADDGLEPLA